MTTTKSSHLITVLYLSGLEVSYPVSIEAQDYEGQVKAARAIAEQQAEGQTIVFFEVKTINQQATK